MAAFFAMNITQFRRDDGGTLSLGYVLGISSKSSVGNLLGICGGGRKITLNSIYLVPISAVVSASFIYIAFNSESFETLIAGLRKLPKVLKPNPTGALGP